MYKSKSKRINTDESESKRINADKRESKRVNVNTCTKDKRESKMVTVIACYTDKSKCIFSQNEYKCEYEKTKDTKDEPLVKNISLIKAPGYFKLCKYSEEVFKNLDAAYECACMKNAKDKYCTEMYDTINN